MNNLTLQTANKAHALTVLSDHNLVQRIQAGDPHAFERLILQYQNRIARLAHRLLGWNNDIDDLLQEVFLAAWQSIHKFKADSSPLTWLMGITINKSRAALRKQSRRKSKPLHNINPNALLAADPEDSPLESAEQNAALRHAVTQLPPKLREVIVLHYLEQLDIPTTAQILKLKRNTTEVRLHRAKTKLKTLLDPEITPNS